MDDKKVRFPGKATKAILTVLEKHDNDIFTLDLQAAHISILYGAANMLIGILLDQGYSREDMMPALNLKKTFTDCYRDMGIKDGLPEKLSEEMYTRKMMEMDYTGRRFVIGMSPMTIFHAHISIVALMDSPNYQILGNSGRDTVQHLRGACRMLIHKMGVPKDVIKDLDPLEFDDSIMEKCVLVWAEGGKDSA